MYIKKRYGESRVESCPFCGNINFRKGLEMNPLPDLKQENKTQKEKTPRKTKREEIVIQY